MKSTEINQIKNWKEVIKFMINLIKVSSKTKQEFSILNNIRKRSKETREI